MSEHESRDAIAAIIGIPGPVLGAASNRPSDQSFARRLLGDAALTDGDRREDFETFRVRFLETRWSS